MRSIGPDIRTRRALLRARLAAAFAAGRARLCMERGSMLIEVMVGAVVLAIATTAILNGIDGAQGTGARNKARSVAAALAEQDQERMRSMRVADLAGYSRTDKVNVRGVDYTVTSAASWSVDNGGVISCSNNSKTSANIRIVSEVSSPLTGGVVDQVSLVTPPAGTYAIGQGRGIVKVVDRAQVPVSGATVELTGPGSFSGTTNSLGCVVFPFIPIGNYTVAVSGLGLVDWQGNTPAIKAMGVVQSQSTLVGFELDKQGTLNVQFDTKVGSATAVPAKSQWVTMLNSKFTVGSKLIDAGAPTSTVSATGLFPFTDGYSVFAGRCTSNNPKVAPTNNAGLLPSYTVGQAQTITTSPKVRVPSINVQVMAANGTVVTASPFATVFVKADPASGCNSTYPSQVSTTSGALPEPGFPYGTYRVCAQRTVAGVTTHGHADVRTSLGYDAKSTSTVAAETSTNRVDDAVPNTAVGGNLTTTGSVGAIRIRLNRQNGCE